MEHFAEGIVSSVISEAKSEWLPQSTVSKTGTLTVSTRYPTKKSPYRTQSMRSCTPYTGQCNSSASKITAHVQAHGFNVH